MGQVGVHKGRGGRIIGHLGRKACHQRRATGLGQILVRAPGSQTLPDQRSKPGKRGDPDGPEAKDTTPVHVTARPARSASAEMVSEGLAGLVVGKAPDPSA